MHASSFVDIEEAVISADTTGSRNNEFFDLFHLLFNEAISQLKVAHYGVLVKPCEDAVIDQQTAGF